MLKAKDKFKDSRISLHFGSYAESRLTFPTLNQLVVSFWYATLSKVGSERSGRKIRKCSSVKGSAHVHAAILAWAHNPHQFAVWGENQERESQMGVRVKVRTLKLQSIRVLGHSSICVRGQIMGFEVTIYDDGATSITRCEG